MTSGFAVISPKSGLPFAGQWRDLGRGDQRPGRAGISSRGIAFDPDTGDLWLCGSNPNSVYRSQDNGATWGAAISGPAGQLKSSMIFGLNPSLGPAPLFADDMGDDQVWTIGVPITPIQVPEADGRPGPDLCRCRVSAPGHRIRPRDPHHFRHVHRGASRRRRRPDCHHRQPYLPLMRTIRSTCPPAVSGGTYDALTYLWTILSGGGSLSGATTATPVYTPPERQRRPPMLRSAAPLRPRVTAPWLPSGTSDEASDTEEFTVLGHRHYRAPPFQPAPGLTAL